MCWTISLVLEQQNVNKYLKRNLQLKKKFMNKKKALGTKMGKIKHYLKKKLLSFSTKKYFNTKIPLIIGK